MTSVLAIASDPVLDSELVEEVRSTHPDRVTVLVLASGFAADRWAVGGGPRERALRDRLALLLGQVEARTGAVVSGTVGDLAMLDDGAGFDDVVRAPAVLAAA
ncbi:MAG TPA: hypothetical protein VHR88_12820 [Solirubrobacteraceae bacterium]|jgi:hypothetical protein|nr:hypothetical protein [Solirubrobacteraceae bacterium]